MHCHPIGQQHQWMSFLAWGCLTQNGSSVCVLRNFYGFTLVSIADKTLITYLTWDNHTKELSSCGCNDNSLRVYSDWTHLVWLKWTKVCFPRLCGIHFQSKYVQVDLGSGQGSILFQGGLFISDLSFSLTLSFLSLNRPKRPP